MAEAVPFRGGRGGRSGRGRGRGSFSSSNGFKANGHGQHGQAQPSSPVVDEPEELRLLRKKHAASLTTIKDLFPGWSDEDLLMALNEAGGDLELTAARISDGHASQWGSVKTKKEKKATGASVASFISDRPLRGGFEGRGRGRGDGTRGGRGGGRVAGPRGTGRGGFSNTANRQVNGKAPASTATITPSAWGADSLSATPATTDTPAWDTPAEVGSGWAEEVAAVELPKENGVPAESTGWGDESNAPPAVAPSKPMVEKKPASKLIPIGSKMSWAQVARPAEPSKSKPAPTPAPSPAPVPPVELVIESEVPAAAFVEEPPPPAHEPDPEQPTVAIPEPSSDVWNLTPSATDASAEASAPNVWNDEHPAQPVGVSEGWSETVLSKPADTGTSIFDSRPEERLALSNAANIGPIEASTSVPAAPPAQEQATQTPAETVATTVLLPPGLGSKRASLRAKGQEAAVVMPGTSGMATPAERMGLQFGSLNLFDSGAAPVPAPAVFEDAPQDKSFKQEEAEPGPQQAPQPAEPTPASAPAPPSTQPAAVEESTAFSQPSAVSGYTDQAPYTVPQPPDQQPAYAQQVQQPLPSQQSAFATRYPATSQYSAPEPAAHVSASAATHRPVLPTVPQQDPFAQSPYARFSQPDPMAAYFQQQHHHHQQSHSHHPIPAHQQAPQQLGAPHSHAASPAPPASQQEPQLQQQQPTSYGSFNPMQQQPQQQPAQPTQAQAQAQTQTGLSGLSQAPQSTQDYSALYGQEALRSLGYYDTYAHAQAAQAAAFQNRSPHPPEDAAKASSTPQAAPQAQQSAQQPQSAAQYPSMGPYGTPYGYPYYTTQFPPGYNNPAAFPYSPYYSMPTNQYGAAGGRSGQSQYPMQQQSAPGQQGGHQSQHSLGGGVGSGGYRQPGQAPGAAPGAQPQHQQAHVGLPYSTYSYDYGQRQQQAAAQGPSDRKDPFAFSPDRFFSQ